MKIHDHHGKMMSVRQPLDTFAPQKTGMNVFAVRKAKGETKRRIIICGHRDAAYEMPVLMHFNTRLLYVIIGITLLGSVLSFLLNNIMFLNFLPQKVHLVFLIIEVFCAITSLLIADTIHEKEELRIYSRGINYTESNAEEACDLLYFSAMQHGLELPYAEFYPGANDSEAFSREGVKSAAICGVRHVPAPYYHTRQDAYTNLNPECIELVRDILRSAVFMFDKAGKIF